MISRITINNCEYKLSYVTSVQSLPEVDIYQIECLPNNKISWKNNNFCPLHVLFDVEDSNLVQRMRSEIGYLLKYKIPSDGPLISIQIDNQTKYNLNLYHKRAHYLNNGGIVSLTFEQYKLYLCLPNGSIINFDYDALNECIIPINIHYDPKLR